MRPQTVTTRNGPLRNSNFDSVHWFESSSFRGFYHDHVLKVDSAHKTLQLDDGPLTTFQAGESEALVIAKDDSSLLVDVTGLNEDFVGDVQVGVMGRIQRVFTGDTIAQ